ncbi:MarR family winged helix-turn-helix transcriptional regulator [Mucilaginibacter pocheonensis]|uniref:DNA-binding MarR family transcriptional regulator n=1 Tax=Mucilaginibacter pocheonensis TaxID=398050 RepID=A0ABU1TFQ6_9SPHI|nr:MarR family transcriptional regulator [Mucilaginibacter pocheonensis]MDR6944238.1 DNA-binding MarR family transcriptional regulator [Mucilaginibacter pocheonensis]
MDILESEYSLTEVRAMYEIYHQPNITARQIKEILKVDEGYLSRLIAKLVKKDIINRIKSEENNRIFSLSLTETGEKTFLQLDQRSSEAAAEIIGHLDKGEQIELIQLLAKVKQLLIKK